MGAGVSSRLVKRLRRDLFRFGETYLVFPFGETYLGSARSVSVRRDLFRFGETCFDLPSFGSARLVSIHRDMFRFGEDFFGSARRVWVRWRYFVSVRRRDLFRFGGETYFESARLVSVR